MDNHFVARLQMGKARATAGEIIHGDVVTVYTDAYPEGTP